MRLLNVTRSVDPGNGGTAEGLRQSIAASAALGHLEEVVTLDPGDAPGVRDYPAPLHVLGPAATKYGYSDRLVPWLRERAASYDAVIVHGLWQYQSLATWKALRHGRVPYVVYPHGMLDPWFKERYPLKHLKKRLYWRLAERRVLRNAAAVLFTTEEEARRATLSFRGYQANSVVVGYGINVDASARVGSAADFFARWPRLRGQRVVLFLGRIDEKKGCDLLIKAFARVAALEPRLHLVIAGPGESSPLARAHAALATSLAVADRITWTGMLTGTDKWSALHAADVFALPSHQENFGVAVVEALAVGLPVLVSDKVNIWQQIVSGGAGFSAPDDVDGTTTLLQRWLALSLEQRVAMQQAAVRCFRQHFDMEVAVSRLIRTIALHVEARPGSPANSIHGHATKPP